MHLQRGHVGHDAAVAQHHHPVRQIEHLVEVVGHQQDAGTLVASLADHLMDPPGLGDAQRGGGLVQQQQLRLAPQGAGQGHELALAARQSAHGPVQGQAVRAHPAQYGRSALAHVALGDHPAAALPAQVDVGHHVEVVAQPVVLPQHLEAGPAHLVGGGGQRHAVQADVALLRLQDAGQARHQRRLARAVLAHHRHDLARADVKAHVPQDGEPAEALGQAPGVQTRHSR